MVLDKYTAKKTAELLLQIKAIKLSPKNPFTWASGWKSPIYCDNRIILSFPEVRKYIQKEFSDKFKRKSKVKSKKRSRVKRPIKRTTKRKSKVKSKKRSTKRKSKRRSRVRRKTA